MKLAALLVLATACTHHQPTTTLRPPAPGTRAIATLTSGREVEVLATPTPDGLRWVAQDTTHAREIIDPDDMRSYTTSRHGRGPIDGIEVGGLSGVAFGVALGLASGDDNCDSCFLEYTATAKAEMGAIFFGGLGVVTGGLLGLMTGTRDVHEVEPTYLPHVTASVASGRAGADLSWSF